MAIGVSYERFMDSCPVELKPFEEANIQRLNTQNAMYHLMGIYVSDALMSTLGNSPYFKSKTDPPHKYPKEPYKIFKTPESHKTEEQNELQKFVAQEEARRANWHMRHKGENG